MIFRLGLCKNYAMPQGYLRLKPRTTAGGLRKREESCFKNLYIYVTTIFFKG